MNEDGVTRDDLTLPKGTPDADTLAKQLQEEFAAGKDIGVTVLKARATLHSPPAAC